MPEVTYDPIHRIIIFSAREKRVIDHPFVQRLRFIRQLGLKSFVYPGAVHDRFSHVLGAMHLAGRVFDALDGKSEVFKRLKPATKKYCEMLLRMAALLHDVGHGPFSHASETLMPRLGSLDIPRKWYGSEYEPKRQAHHEDFSVLLIRTLGSRRERIFSETEAQDISSIVHKSVRPSKQWSKRFRSPLEARRYHIFLRRLISGELDVDRMDYLLRDSHFTGVPYGSYDIEWLLHTMGAVMLRGTPTLVIHESGLHAFEDFLLARYHMFAQVYFHRTTAIFEYYVRQAMRAGEIEFEIPADPYAYTELRDGSVIEAMYRAAKDSKNTWSRLLTRREALPLIYQSDGGDRESMRRYGIMVRALAWANIQFIERKGKRTLAEFNPGSSETSGIFIARKFLDQLEYVPVERLSLLLQKYNERIERRYLYVARADYPRALRVLHKAFRMA